MSPPSAALRGTLFIFGAGFIGEHVAKQAARCGYSVLGTTRRRSRVAELTQLGVVQDPLLFRGDEPLPEDVVRSQLSTVTHVLSTVPPNLGDDPVLVHHARTLESCMPSLRWVGHISTAAVYGTASEIDAKTVPRPSAVGERLRMNIEREWAALSLPDHTAPVRIFRPTSVYGPWRGPQQLLREGRAVAIEKADFVASRVHVDDVAAAIVASMMEVDGAGRAGEVEASPGSSALAEGDEDEAMEDGCPVEGAGCSTYLLTDTEPAAPSDVLHYASSLFGGPPLTTMAYADAEAHMSATARAFWANPVRASPSAFAALGLQLTHPSYKEGLRAVKETEGERGAELMREAAANANAEAEAAEAAANAAPAQRTRKARAASGEGSPSAPATSESAPAPRAAKAAKPRKAVATAAVADAAATAAATAALLVPATASLSEAVELISGSGPWQACDALEGTEIRRTWDYGSANAARDAMMRLLVRRGYEPGWVEPMLLQVTSTKVEVGLPARGGGAELGQAVRLLEQLAESGGESAADSGAIPPAASPTASPTAPPTAPPTDSSRAGAAATAGSSGGGGEGAAAELRALPPEEMSRRTVVDLKRLLKGLGLKVSGTKAQLIERLTEHKASL